ncbi:hypothetical protein ACLOJK_021844 [Asimina triloba]
MTRQTRNKDGILEGDLDRLTNPTRALEAGGFYRSPGLSWGSSSEKSRETAGIAEEEKPWRGFAEKWESVRALYQQSPIYRFNNETEDPDEDAGRTDKPNECSDDKHGSLPLDLNDKWVKLDYYESTKSNREFNGHSSARGPSASRAPIVDGDMSTSDREDAQDPRCDRLHEALCDCHRRFRSSLERDVACRHLNRALATCLVAGACPSESEAVSALCASSGTAQKRAQCQQAQLSLSVCLASHQSLLQNPP